MKMLQEGCVVKSIAGHDKDRFYVAVGVHADHVYIAGGKARKLAKPKRKNIRHVRATRTILDLNELKTEKKLREALKAFEAGSQGCEGGN